MDRDDLKMLFTLAGFKFEDATQYENQFWPKKAAYDQHRKDDPWWLVDTNRGFIELGWRDQDFHLDWSDTGVVFPMIDPQGVIRPMDTHIVRGDETIRFGETWCRPASIGQVLDMLTRLKMTFPRYDELRKHWSRHPETLTNSVPWIVNGKRRAWHRGNGSTPPETNYRVYAASRTRALEKFYEHFPRHHHMWAFPESFVDTTRQKIDEVMAKKNPQLLEALAA